MTASPGDRFPRRTLVGNLVNGYYVATSRLLLFVEDVLRTAFPPFRRTLYLILAPLSLLALIACQGASGHLDLAFGYVQRPFDFVLSAALHAYVLSSFLSATLALP